MTSRGLQTRLADVALRGSSANARLNRRHSAPPCRLLTRAVLWGRFVVYPLEWNKARSFSNAAFRNTFVALVESQRERDDISSERLLRDDTKADSGQDRFFSVSRGRCLCLSGGRFLATASPGSRSLQRGRGTQSRQIDTHPGAARQDPRSRWPRRRRQQGFLLADPEPRPDQVGTPSRDRRRACISITTNSAPSFAARTLSRRSLLRTN